MYSFTRLKPDSEALSIFVANHPRGNIYQSPHLQSIYKNSATHNPFIFGVLDQDRNILAVLSGVFHANYSWPINIFTKRAIITGGPLVHNDDKKVLSFLLLNYKSAVRNQCIYSQFRNIWDQSDWLEIFRKNGFPYEEHLDIFIDLCGSQQEITDRISKNKRRNVVKSTNKGCIFREITDRREYIQSLGLIYKTYTRIGLPVSGREVFVNAFDNLRPVKKLKCFGIFKDEKCLGIRIELLYRDCIYDWYAGSDDENKNLYPNDFLIYHVLLWGNKEKFRKFMFGGAGKPGIPYGVREHKMKFGGKLVEYGRYEIIHQKFRYIIGTFAYRLLFRK